MKQPTLFERGNGRRRRANGRAPQIPALELCQAVYGRFEGAGIIGAARAVKKPAALGLCGTLISPGQPSRERKFRAVIAEAPRYGIPLVSCNDGYYIAITRSDFDRQIADLNARARQLHERIAAIEELREDAEPDD